MIPPYTQGHPCICQLGLTNMGSTLAVPKLLDVLLFGGLPLLHQLPQEEGNLFLVQGWVIPNVHSAKTWKCIEEGGTDLGGGGQAPCDMISIVRALTWAL